MKFKIQFENKNFKKPKKMKFKIQLVSLKNNIKNLKR